MDAFEQVDQELLLTARARIIASEIGEHESRLGEGVADVAMPSDRSADVIVDA